MDQLSFFIDEKVVRDFDFVYGRGYGTFFYKPPFFSVYHKVEVVKCFILNGVRRIVLYDGRDFEYVDECYNSYIPIGVFYELL